MEKNKKSKPVLIVDDDAEYLNFLRIAIGTVYPVVSATSGEEAIQTAKKTRPGVIILDVMMPGGQDGFATFCDLRSGKDTSHIPVIILSSVSKITGLDFGPESMEQFLGAAPTAFLEKPVAAERLLSELRKALGEEPEDR